MNWTKEKIDLLTSLLADGENHRDIARKMNVSYDSLTHAIQRYDLAGYKAVSPRSAKIISSVDMEVLNDDNFEQLKKEAVLKWKVAKSNIPATKKRPYKLALVTSDQHIPHEDESSLRGIFQLMDDEKFDVNILLGDFLDYGCISHWNQGRNKTLEMQRLKNDYIKGNAILDEYDKRLPKNCEKHFFKGNHEVWIDDGLIEKTPQLEGLVEPESQLFLKERGYKIYPYNDVVPFGRLHLTHGIYAGANPTKKHLDELKVNVMFGHTHTMEVRMSSSPAREIAFSGYNVGCLCNMAPDYMKNRPHGWTQGFAVVYLYPNGYFDVQLIRIIDGKFIYNGKIYDGSKK